MRRVFIFESLFWSLCGERGEVGFEVVALLRGSRCCNLGGGTVFWIMGVSVEISGGFRGSF